ncbi:hypothetical protein CC86DRAFT_348743 [Ophiobolus disseminans]|uniref:C3H1-type domain-containing protein n=1 Tax=Ophiobolus disseminans TaxID=1469910 RepID=A0A6A7A2M8_9PLEO|nr:hypothetical protein CC86DRAFT_348743 [Ophiobolus disseminans]
MTVCRYWGQSGGCARGDNCKFEHPGSQRDSNRNSRGGGGGFGGGSNNNRFGAFNNVDRYRPNPPNPPNQSSGGSFANNRDAKPPAYHLDKNDMKNDLTGGRPIYPLSCYGPGRDVPRQLIEGPVEISPEELRVRYYAQRLAGNEAGAQEEESALNEKMSQQVKSILDDIDGAIRYIEEGANVHPNRIDIAKGNTGPTSVSRSPATNANPFSSAPANPVQTASNPFLKAPTATFGQSSTPGFGQPAFGQAANPGHVAPAFGQPSNPGQAAPGFGAASSLGPKPLPFGQTSAAPAGGAFGKPAFGTSGFGQPSMPGVGGAGGASVIGLKPAFGQASAVAPSAPFGQASAMGQQTNAFGKPAFGQTGFGQASQLGAGGAPFGQTAQPNASPFGQQLAAAPAAPAFGQTSQSTQQQPAFGTTQNQPAGGQANPFASTSASQPSVFGQPTRPTTSGSPFGGGQQNQPASPQAQNLFQQQPQASTAAPATAANPFGPRITQPASPFAQTSAQQTSSPAVSGAASNIDEKDRFKEGKPEDYEGEQGRMLEEIYRRVGQMGRFNDNEDIPLIPPKCEWIVQIPL